MKELVWTEKISRIYNADWKRATYDLMNSQIVYLNETPSIVFIGDSITEFWETANLFREYGRVLNRGIASDVVYGVASRFDLDVLQLHPKLCVLLVGVNELGVKVDRFARRELFKTGTLGDINGYIERYTDELLPLYAEMLEKSRKEGLKLLLCSVLPIRGEAYKNRYIKTLNKKLEGLAKAYDGEYVDFFSATQDGNGELSKEYSYDGCHPNGKGYERMRTVLKPFLEKYLW